MQMLVNIPQIIELAVANLEMPFRFIPYMQGRNQDFAKGGA